MISTVSGDLATAARTLLEATDGEIASSRTRAATLLTRQALEVAVEDALASHVGSVSGWSYTARLLCLGEYTSGRLAAECAHLWDMLSNACHHRVYELAPSHAQLASWIDEAERLIAELGSDPESPTT